MPIVILLVGAILLVAAWKNTLGAVGSALAADVPPFGRQFAAIGLVGALGIVPGMRLPSRYLLGLVMLVIVLTQYKSVLAGLRNAASGAGVRTASVTSPAAAYAASPGTPITTAEITGTPPGATSAVATVPNPLSPQTYLQPYQNAGGGTGTDMGFGSSTVAI